MVVYVVPRLEPSLPALEVVVAGPNSSGAHCSMQLCRYASLFRHVCASWVGLAMNQGIGSMRIQQWIVISSYIFQTWSIWSMNKHRHWTSNTTKQLTMTFVCHSIISSQVTLPWHCPPLTLPHVSEGLAGSFWPSKVQSVSTGSPDARASKHSFLKILSGFGIWASKSSARMFFQDLSSMKQICTWIHHFPS